MLEFSRHHELETEKAYFSIVLPSQSPNASPSSKHADGSPVYFHRAVSSADAPSGSFFSAQSETPPEASSSDVQDVLRRFKREMSPTR